MKILFKIVAEEPLILDVESTDTIMPNKQKLQQIEGVPIHLQRLVFKRQELENEKPLSEYSIQNGNHLRFILRVRTVMKIYVKIPNSKALPFDVEPSECIELTKRKIQELEIPINQQILLYLGKEFNNNNKSYSHYNIQNQTTLNLIRPRNQN